MDSNAKQVLKNLEFIDKLRQVSNVTGKIAEIEAMSDSKKQDTDNLESQKKQLHELQKDLNHLTDSYVGHKYTKEGTSRTNIIEQWLEQTLANEKRKPNCWSYKMHAVNSVNAICFMPPWVPPSNKKSEPSISRNVTT